jgi:hypothetical protein
MKRTQALPESNLLGIHLKYDENVKFERVLKKKALLIFSEYTMP